jgi:hypothetical protein
MKKYKNILDVAKNPRCSEYIKDVSPILDILSSATQTIDLGTKILLINCCLETLFIPEDTHNNHQKYII